MLEEGPPFRRPLREDALFWTDRWTRDVPRACFWLDLGPQFVHDVGRPGGHAARNPQHALTVTAFDGGPRQEVEPCRHPFNGQVEEPRVVGRRHGGAEPQGDALGLGPGQRLATQPRMPCVAGQRTGRIVVAQRAAGHVVGHVRAGTFQQGCKVCDVVLRGQRVEHVGGPPVGGVAGRHQRLVVLHEFAVAQHQLAVVPDRGHVLAQGKVGVQIVNAAEGTVAQDDPGSLAFVARGDGAGFARALDFHLRPDGDEVVHGRHARGIGAGRSQA